MEKQELKEVVTLVKDQLLGLALEFPYSEATMHILASSVALEALAIALEGPEALNEYIENTRKALSAHPAQVADEFLKKLESLYEDQKGS